MASSGGEHHEEAEDSYGDAATIGALRQLYAGYAWADVASLGPESSGRAVRVRGAAQAVRAVGRRVAFLVLRQGTATVQCVVAGDGGGGMAMARFAAGLSRESVVDVAGAVSLPRDPVRGTTQPAARGDQGGEAPLRQQGRPRPPHRRRRRGAERGGRRQSQSGRGAGGSCWAGQAAGLPGDRPPHRRQPGHLPCPMPGRKRVQAGAAVGRVRGHPHAEADRRFERGRRRRVQAGLQRAGGVPGAVAAAAQADGRVRRLRPRLRGGPRVQGRGLRHPPPPLRVRRPRRRDGAQGPLHRGVRRRGQAVRRHVRPPQRQVRQGAGGHPQAVPVPAVEVPEDDAAHGLRRGHPDAAGSRGTRGRHGRPQHGGREEAGRPRPRPVRHGVLHAVPVPVGGEAVLHDAVPGGPALQLLLRRLRPWRGDHLGGAAGARPGPAGGAGGGAGHRRRLHRHLRRRVPVRRAAARRVRRRAGARRHALLRPR